MEWNATLRAGLHAWLQQEFPGFRIEVAADREQAERAVTSCTVALVLVNIDAQRGEGFATLRALHSLQPEALLIALSLYPVDYFREKAMHAGAAGCACVALADDTLRDLLRELLPTTQRGISVNVDGAC